MFVLAVSGCSEPRRWSCSEFISDSDFMPWFLVDSSCAVRAFGLALAAYESVWLWSSSLCNSVGASALAAAAGVAPAMSAAFCAGLAGVAGVAGVAGAAGIAVVAGVAGIAGVAPLAGAAFPAGIAGVAAVAGVAGVAAVAGVAGVAAVAGVAGVAAVSGVGEAREVEMAATIASSGETMGWVGAASLVSVGGATVRPMMICVDAT